MSIQGVRANGWLAPLSLSLAMGAFALGPAAAQAAQATQAVAASSPKAAVCATCGVVTQVQAYQVKGKGGSGVGVVGGAVLGGLLGNQMGRGTGNAIMTVGGAVAGGYAGNEVEKHVNKRTLYKTTVRMDDGSQRVLSVSKAFAIGSKVNVSGKKITARAP